MAPRSRASARRSASYAPAGLTYKMHRLADVRTYPHMFATHERVRGMPAVIVRRSWQFSVQVVDDDSSGGCGCPTVRASAYCASSCSGRRWESRVFSRVSFSVVPVFFRVSREKSRIRKFVSSCSLYRAKVFSRCFSSQCAPFAFSRRLACCVFCERRSCVTSSCDNRRVHSRNNVQVNEGAKWNLRETPIIIAIRAVSKIALENMSSWQFYGIRECSRSVLPLAMWAVFWRFM